MPVVDEGQDTAMGDEVGRGVLLPALALVEDHDHLHATLLGIEECLGNGFAGERVRLRISVLAASSSLTTAAVAPPFGEK